MNIAGSTSLKRDGMVLTGYYTWGTSQGVKAKLFEFSSPLFNINNFTAPYDAILLNKKPTGDTYTAVGRRIRNYADPIYSNISGAMYFYSSPSLVGACHGFGRDSLTYYSGYNFYNAFYPGGYFQPPFGETLSLFKLNQEELESLRQGACAPLSRTEYNEQFGIVSRVAGSTSSTLSPGSLQQIMSIKETCPETTIAAPTYYEELQVKQIPGTSSSITASTLYNHNPIPTSLDNYDTWVDGRYEYTGNDEEEQNYILTGADGRPIPSYSSTSTSHSKLNNPLCYAQLFETKTSVGRLTNGLQRLESPDLLPGAIGDQASAIGQESWHYWHFTFKENADTIPFESDFLKVTPGSTRRTISQGTQMFNPVLSSPDSFWQNRQCPDTVDFLPWTFGASIYACPSEHFDVPYYASIKKFGFYGTRFLNSCKKLNLDHPLSGVDNAVEVATGEKIILPQPEIEPDDIDGNGNVSFSNYDNLLRIAKSEERYSNMYALNKGFFLWANTGCIVQEPTWTYLTGHYTWFPSVFWNMVYKFRDVYQNGLSSFVSGEPSIIIQQNEITSTFSVLDSGKYSDILFTNDAYIGFKKQLDNLIDTPGLNSWQYLEDNYSNFVSNCFGNINESFYTTIASGREKRFRTRYFENIIRGNPVDLFPMNHITFATDNARSYLESPNWGRNTTSFGANSSLPAIQRRYFEGAYGNASASSGISDTLRKLSIASDSAFYPGFFNSYLVNKESPTPRYTPVLSGYIKDLVGRKYSASGWLAAGYNEVGALDSNFSCFTPIFVQQPLPKVFCKVGQHPTLRALAVDYHSIPEDKISYKYPEIIYWTHKLKISNSNFENNYPMRYKWFRVLKTEYSLFVDVADFSYAHFSDSAGDWCAMEGEANTCTIIHPSKCFPPYSSTIEGEYAYIQGVEVDNDDKYYYLCLAVGRFGIRISEPTELVIEEWLKFDVSFKNGMNKTKKLKIQFIINDARAEETAGINKIITFEAKSKSPYLGYQQDTSAIPESAIEQKSPPPNAGWGDISATRFIGSQGYVGATRTYIPDTLYDVRGQRERWGRMIDYGYLVQFSRKLNQEEGNLLYGHQHLPTCTNYSMPKGQKGIRVEASIGDNLISHWTLKQRAFASTDKKYGIPWGKISNIGGLYPPANIEWDILYPSSVGLGHWQWGVNLGSIKRFGESSTIDSHDLVIRGPGLLSTRPNPNTFKQIKEELIRPTTLAGTNCGYTKYGLGRNMLYYIEAYDRFYLVCDPAGKKNVQNLSFICPGLRFNNAAIQYFWLGQPNNTYVERRPMYGPYAYQWRVRRHNRDRNGNGMPRSFYSMSEKTNFELMYDAPAIYGLYIKRDSSPEYKDKVRQIKELRKKVIDINGDIAGLRNIWFGEPGGEGTYKKYGSMTFSCDSTNPAYNSGVCEYMNMARDLANSPDFKVYSCPPDRLKRGECFDPCLSIRYGQGFFPGGKSQDLFGYSELRSANYEAPHNLRLVAQANYFNGTLNVNDETIAADPNTLFRSPINTPHARVWRGLQIIPGATFNHIEDVAGISPCKDGGSDHCNYMTATIHLDSTSTILGKTSAFNGSFGYASNYIAGTTEASS